MSGIGKHQMRMICTEFNTRTEENGAPVIEGYFAVFNSIYQIADGMTESIAPGAFSEALGGDIRGLINHDSTYVLGRNRSGTLSLREDANGLWGEIRINPNDTDAMNLWERVKRGDVDGCSIGFDIKRESTEILPDGTTHWTIEEIQPLFEVSVVTFPAYEETHVQARAAQRDDIKRREVQSWRERMKARITHHA